MRRARVFALAVAGAVLGSCALGLPELPWPAAEEAPPETGQVELQVYSGFAAGAASAAVAPTRTVVLVDATRSMQRKAAQGGTLFDVARSGASAVVRAAPPSEELSVHAIGHRQAGACAVPERLTTASSARARSLAAVEGLRTGGEGSIAVALREVQTELDSEGATRGTTVVVFTDLDPACGGDLCDAAQSFVEAGGWIDLHVVGDAKPPACLAALHPAPTPPTRAALSAPPPPTFRVVEALGDVHPVLASGRAGDGAVTAAAGLVSLDVDLVPPERVGPFRLRPGERVLVRLVDFPGATPPDRAWQVERPGEVYEQPMPEDTGASSRETSP